VNTSSLCSLITQSLQLYLFAEPFPLQITLIAIFAGVILVLLVTIMVILFRKRICCYNTDKDQDKASGTSTTSSGLPNNVIVKVNNMDQMSNGSSSAHLKQSRDLHTPLSNEADSACWEGSDNQDGNFRNNTTELFRHNSDLEPDFPPVRTNTAAK
jgi:hypothetical protein